MPYKKINIAIVGFGNIGSYFYKTLEKNKKKICTKTGKMASYTNRIVDNDELILLGDIKKYEALSRKAFNRLNNLSQFKKD